MNPTVIAFMLLAQFLILGVSLALVLRAVQQGERHMSQALADLQAEVAAAVTVEQSAVTLVNGLAAQLAAVIAAGNNDPALQALHDSLKTQTDALSAAITANTPAAPAATTAK